MPSLEIKRQVLAAAEAAEDKKAEDIRILALDPSESSLTDYFLICNGTNDRQNVAIGDEIEARMKRDFGMYPNSIEGRRQGEWVLMDYVDFVVHIFSPEKREYYGLERLRKSAKLVSMSELDAELNNRVRAARVANPVPVVAAVEEVSATTPMPAIETSMPPAMPLHSREVKAPVKKKAVAKKAAAKKTVATKPATKKTVVKKAAKAPAKKTVAKKAAKAPAKKAVVKKAAKKKTIAKKVVAKKAVKKATAKKIVKKVAAKKAVAKKPVKKAITKKTAKKPTAKKVVAKKTIKKPAPKKTGKKKKK
jgi:ribosome-associated protein